MLKARRNNNKFVAYLISLRVPLARDVGRRASDVRRRAGDRGSVGPASRLDGVTERFQSFFGDLEQEKQQRRLEEAAWHSQVQDMFTKVERSIE
eukprot:evm.model.scf_470.9 EVM.evm.TU.scf_470.9   scf_470:3595-4892(-)